MNESIIQYTAASRSLATTYSFKEYLKQVLRDQSVCGLCHKPTQKKLLTNFKLTLVKAIEIAQNKEAGEKNLQQIKDPRSASSYEIITECATSNKQSTTSNLEVVTDVVTQIMQQRTANLGKLSATSAEQ